MRHLVVALAMALLIVATTAGAGSVPGSAYITDFGNGSVLHVNVQTGEAPTHIGVGPSPFGVAILPDGSRVYVSNNGNGSVSVINTADNSVSSIAVGKSPMGVAVAKFPDGQYRVFVANLLSPTLSVIDAATNSLITTPSVIVGKFARGVAVHPTSPYLYVTNMGSDGVTIVRTTDLSVVKLNAPVGIDPFGIAVAPNGLEVYVALEGEGKLAILDPLSAIPMRPPVQVGSRPTGVAVHPTEPYVYVTNKDSNTLSVVNTATGKVTTVPVGTSPVGVAVSSDGSRVYVANSGGASLSVLDAEGNIVGAPISLPGSFPTAFGAFVVPGSTFTLVSIDIMPGGNPNTINLRSKSKEATVPVAILTTNDFDATRVNPETVTLAGAPVKMKPDGTPMAAHEDVDGDGRPDLVVHVERDKIELTVEDTEAVLMGATYPDEKNVVTSIRGTDTVKVIK